MIRVGINESVFIRDAKLETETTRLRITFEEDGPVKYANAFERMNAEDAVEHLPTRDILLFPTIPPDEKDAKGNMRTLEQKVGMINSSHTSLKAQLRSILMGYMTSKDATLDLYAGLNIDANNFNERIILKENVIGVCKNMFLQFIQKMQPFLLGEASAKFRLLLVRQNAANNFPTLRSNYVTENPFWEPMEIKKEESKVTFTPYEIKEGLDNDLPASRKDADKTKGRSSDKGGEPARTAEDVFGV